MIFFTENKNEDLTFEYGPGTEARNGCGATIKNEFWYFGGSSRYNRQVKWQNTCRIFIYSISG